MYSETLETVATHMGRVSQRRTSNAHHPEVFITASSTEISTSLIEKSSIFSLGERNPLLLPNVRDGAPHSGALKKMNTRSPLPSPSPQSSSEFTTFIPPQQPSTTAAAKSFPENFDTSNLFMISIGLILSSITILIIAILITFGKRRRRRRKLQDEKLHQEELGSPLHERKTPPLTSTSPPSFSRQDSNSSTEASSCKKKGKEAEEWPALFGGGDAPPPSRSQSSLPLYPSPPPPKIATNVSKKNAIMNMRELEDTDKALLTQLPAPVERKIGFFESRNVGKEYLADVGGKKSLLELELMKQRIAMERVGKWRDLVLRTEQDSIEVGSTRETLPARGRGVDDLTVKDVSRKGSRRHDDESIPTKVVTTQTSSSSMSTQHRKECAISALGISEPPPTSTLCENPASPVPPSNIPSPKNINLTFGKHDRPTLTRNKTVALESVDNLFD